MSILRKLVDAGLSVRSDPSGAIALKPSSRLTNDLRRLVCDHRAQLIAELDEAHRITAELVDAAMRVCDHHGDDQAARDQMKRECEQTPPHLRADLLHHFRATCEAQLPSSPSASSCGVASVTTPNYPPQSRGAIFGENHESEIND